LKKERATDEYPDDRGDEACKHAKRQTGAAAHGAPSSNDDGASADTDPSGDKGDIALASRVGTRAPNMPITSANAIVVAPILKPAWATGGP
jgi:hypothetical protein